MITFHDHVEPPQSDETSSAPIIAEAGKISILDTVVTTYDASTDGPDERLDGRAYIAALSYEDDDGVAHTSRMDVERSDISYLGNEGDYHNDIGEFSSRLETFHTPNEPIAKSNLSTNPMDQLN